MTSGKTTRRGLMAGLLSLGGIMFFWQKTGGTGAANAATGTPGAAGGPFYPTSEMRLPDIDNDLVKVTGLVQDAGGEVIMLKGKVTDRLGNPLAGHRVEIWQCDLNGRYLHPGDSQGVAYDQGFQGFGHDITDGDGNYSFRTIKPGRYPGRTPHIHVKLFRGEAELLTTQFYVAGDDANARDSLFRRMSDAGAESVSMVYIETETGTETTVNIQI